MAYLIFFLLYSHFFFFILKFNYSCYQVQFFPTSGTLMFIDTCFNSLHHCLSSHSFLPCFFFFNSISLQLFMCNSHPFILICSVLCLKAFFNRLFNFNQSIKFLNQFPNKILLLDLWVGLGVINFKFSLLMRLFGS